MKHTLLSAALLAACGFALAKLPPTVQDDAAKAKAAETAAKTAWQAKADAFLLCRAQDRAAANHMKTVGKAGAAAGKDAKAAVPAKATVPVAAPAGAASGTPAPNVAVAPTLPPCADPGPFAYAPPEQKPLETSGAHSPAPTAKSPPSVSKTSSEMAPGGKKP